LKIQQIGEQLTAVTMWLTAHRRVKMATIPIIRAVLVGVTVRRERCWTPAGATPARELIRSTREVVSSVSRYNDGCELADVQST
jgi:hypothetical protein